MKHMQVLTLLFLSILTTILLTFSIVSAQPQHGIMMEPLSIVDATNPLYGTALNATTLQNAITAQGSNRKTIYLKCSAWTLATNVTAPANITLWIPYCTIVTINTGITLTLNSPPIVESPTWHAGPGKIIAQYSMVNVRDLSTGGNGAVGSPWTGWDTALTTWQGSITYLFPPGHFQLTAPMFQTQNTTQMTGAGKDATILHYVPTTDSANGVFTFASGSQINTGSGLRGLTILTTDTTHTKVGVKLVDVSGFTMNDVRIGNDGGWTGNGSIGLAVNGRGALLIDGTEIYADRPLVIGKNPNSTVDLDHAIFSKGLLQETIGLANPLVEIGTGLNLTSVLFEEQAWYRGFTGLSWVDTTSTIRGISLTLQNVGWEQGSEANGYFVRIEHNTVLRGLRLINLFGALNSHGIRLRKVQVTKLENVQYLGTGTALDVNSTVYPIVLENVWIGSGSLSLGGLTSAMDGGSSDGRIIPFMVYDR